MALITAQALGNVIKAATQKKMDGREIQVQNFLKSSTVKTIVFPIKSTISTYNIVGLGHYLNPTA